MSRSASYDRTYAAMSNDELLNVATTASDLVDEARHALKEELARRRLSESDVLQYRRHLDSIRPGKMPGTPEYVARSFNGFGMQIYGKRDFWSDGSFVTTKWIVFLWIPLLPLSSLRVKQIPDADPGSGPLTIWSASYYVYSKAWPIPKQVLFVYVYVVAIALAGYLTISASGTGISHALHAIPICMLLALPWSLRKLARH